VTRLDKQKN